MIKRIVCDFEDVKDFEFFYTNKDKYIKLPYKKVTCYSSTSPNYDLEFNACSVTDDITPYVKFNPTDEVIVVPTTPTQEIIRGIYDEILNKFGECYVCRKNKHRDWEYVTDMESVLEIIREGEHEKNT